MHSVQFIWSLVFKAENPQSACLTILNALSLEIYLNNTKPLLKHHHLYDIRVQSNTHDQNGRTAGLI